MKVGVLGCLGRMGKEICTLLLQDSDVVKVVGCISSHDSCIKGDLGKILGVSTNKYYTMVNDIDTMVKESDIVIDFSNKLSLQECMESCMHTKVKLVSGTTGIDESLISRMEKHYSKYMAILWSANMSLGINLLLHFIQIAKKELGDQYDIHIFDTHHKYKKDTPSGTAKLFGKAAEIKNEHCYSSARCGGVIGDSSIMFADDNEIITLEHRAINRILFAQGAIKAAKWLYSSDVGVGLYSMREVLNV